MANLIQKMKGVCVGKKVVMKGNCNGYQEKVIEIVTVETCGCKGEVLMKKREATTREEVETCRCKGDILMKKRETTTREEKKRLMDIRERQRW